MNSRDFCFWLQGFFELRGDQFGTQHISAEQAKLIQRHLNLVFKHEIDPSMGDENHQQLLNEVHIAPGNGISISEPYTVNGLQWSYTHTPPELLVRC